MPTFDWTEYNRRLEEQRRHAMEMERLREEEKLLWQLVAVFGAVIFLIAAGFMIF